MKKNLFYLFAFVAIVLSACSDDDAAPAYIPPTSGVNMTEMCQKDGVLYGFLSTYDANWNQTIVHSSYNPATGAVKTPWIAGDAPSSPYKMFAAGDYVCVTTSDYMNDGDVNLFTADGHLLADFSAGVGPRKGIVVDDNLYVLCEGLWGENNSALTKYNIAEDSHVRDCFMEQNGYGLGDTANDICLYGSKMYIAVATDKIIWVLDKKTCIVEGKIATEGEPRYLATAGGKLYATYYNGYVARIDTASLAVEKKVQVGRNPEQLCVADNKLFVANSGGADYPNYDNTVSVIDIPSFTEIKKIEVATNPANILTADNGFVYLVSLGNYGDVPNTLQCINPYTYEVENLSE